MVLTDYFDGAFCINLDHRTDKWAECEKEFEKHGLAVTRWSAVNGREVHHVDGLKPGVVGCLLSHKELIQFADTVGLETVLILEDDVAFDDELNNKFFSWITEVPIDWDMLYLGGNHNTKKIVKCDEHLMRATNTQTTHAYAVRRSLFKTILNRLERIDFDVDVIYTEIQKQCAAYCFTPRLAWQRPGVSDIWNQHVDYDFLRLNDGCHK